MAKSRLHELAARGQSIWFDTLSRDLVGSGELKKMMEEDAVVGVTSNPTIFQKALAEGDAYDEQMRACLDELDDPREIFFRLALEDIRDACDVLRPVWDQGKGQDGYVSMEVEPDLAYDTEATFDGSPPAATSRSSPRRYASTTARYRSSEKISVMLIGVPFAMQSSMAGRPAIVAGIFTNRFGRSISLAIQRACSNVASVS